MVNKSDPISDKLSRLSDIVDKMKIGELILPSPLFKSININPTSGNGWYKMHQTLLSIPLKPLFDENGEIRAFQRISEEQTDISNTILKELKEIKKEVKEIKNVKE